MSNLMTGKTKLRLLTETESIIIEDAKNLDNTRQLLSFINKLFTQKKIIIEKDATWINTEDLLRYRLFLGILILDLSVAMRLYLKSTYQYEGIYAARQIIIIINEGYKKIYGFIQEKPGNELTKNRNNSFWIKNIGRIIDEDLLHLKKDYDRITKKLNDCLSINFNTIKTQRDLSIHYDDHPEKVYDMLVDLNIDEIFNKLIPFLNILQNMRTFTNRMVISYKIKSDKAKIGTLYMIDHAKNYLDKLENENNRKQILELKDQLRSIEKLFNDFNNSLNT